MIVSNWITCETIKSDYLCTTDKNYHCKYMYFNQILDNHDIVY